MASEGITFAANFEKLDELRTALENVFSKQEMAAILRQALDEAIIPAYQRLQQLAPRGPTGNLANAVNYKTKAYPRDGNAIGLVGFNRASRGDLTKAPHQWLVEYGTKERPVTRFSNTPYQRRSKLGNVHTVRGQNSYIASSYTKRGQFKIVASGDSLTTTPPSPKAFFKKSRTPFKIPAMPVGGRAGIPPLKTAFEQSQGEVGSRLETQLSSVLNSIVQKLPVDKTGSLSG